MNKAFLFSFLFAFSLLGACGQSNKDVIKACGYFMIPTPGTIAVDDNGRPLNPFRDTVFTLYVETKSNSIKWERAWKGGRSFNVIPLKIGQGEIVGKSKTGEKKVEASAGKGNTLWKLELADDTQKQKAPKPASHRGILLKAMNGKRPLYIEIKSLVELSSPEYQ
jgi:hypothetical protein